MATYCWPVKALKKSISSPYGMRTRANGNREMHYGVDIPAPSGTLIVATDAGTVIESGTEKSSGNYITIKHKDFYASYYHCLRTDKKKGDAVKAGDPIALVGSTGNSTGNHLHFQIGTALKSTGWMDKTTCIDPLKYDYYFHGQKPATPPPPKPPTPKPPPPKPPAAKPKPKAGDPVTLKNTPLYKNSTTATRSSLKTGTYYLYDGQAVNGRYRITNSLKRVGKRPIALYVTGWIDASAIK